MCQFVSWKEYNDKIYFIQDSDLNTKEGKKLLLPDVIADILGHGAIDSYYPELKGKGSNKECSDFTSLINFPDEIVKAIKSGKLSRIGYSLELLNNAGKAEFEKIRQPAWAEYQKIRQPAWAEFEKIRQPAFWQIFKKKKYRNSAWI